MKEKKQIARTAGFFYLLFLILGGFAELVRSKLLVPDNASATIQNIVDHAMLYRWSLVSDLAGETVYVILVFLLYKLLNSVDKNAAALMSILVLVGVPIAMISQTYPFSVLQLVTNTAALGSFTPDQLQAQAMLFLSQYRNGILVAEIFWGLWLIPFGYLVYKSGFLPKVIGILLMLGSTGFVSEFLVMILNPQWKMLTYPGMAIATLGELSMIFWLLAFGINVKNKQKLTTESTIVIKDDSV